MDHVPATCPRCDMLIVVNQRDVFARCPHCEKNISVEDAIRIMRDITSRPTAITSLIARCIKIEAEYGPEVPIAVLAMVEENFPLNEEVGYMIVKMSDFQPMVVRNYLAKFRNAEKKQVFVEDFLQRALNVRNMEYANQFEEYIRNRLPQKRQHTYIELLRELREQYTKTSNSPTAMTLLYTFYAVFATVNIAMVALFIIATLPLWLMAIICVTVLTGQIGLLYLHNKVYGNRIDISDTERLVMVIYMSTLIIAIGGVFLGWGISL